MTINLFGKSGVGSTGLSQNEFVSSSVCYSRNQSIIIYYYAPCGMYLQTGALKLQELTMQEWTMTEKVAGVDFAGVDIDGESCRGGHCRSGH